MTHLDRLQSMIDLVFPGLMAITLEVAELDRVIGRTTAIESKTSFMSEAPAASG